MVFKYVRIRRMSLPVLCLILMLVIVLIYITDFPRSPSIDNSQPVIEYFYQKPVRTDRFADTRQVLEFANHNPESLDHSAGTDIQREFSNDIFRTESMPRETTTTEAETEAAPTSISNTRLLDDKKMTEIERRFQARKEHLKNYCSKTNPRQIKKCEAKDIVKSLKYVPEDDLLYCAIEKTGSTFWKRILHVAGGWGNDSSPHSIAAKDADEVNGGFQILENVTYSELDEIFQNANSIMFVRDPFTRLFSAWLDKFYSTNPYYWRLYGRRIIKTERRKPTNTSQACGHDVTFPEFVRFVSKYIKRDRCMDRHFNPNFKHCAPCYLSYEYIGKYETLKEDTYFLLEKLNLSDVVTFADFEKDAIDDVIRNDAEWLFSNKNETQDCLPFRCGLFRVWKRFQSRGVISKHIDLPYKTNEEADSVTVDEFAQAVVDAHKKSDKKETAQNRQEVLKEAFGLLPDRVRKLMLDALEPDFELFSYDRNPSFLHGNSTTKSVKEYTVECPFSFEDP